MRIKFKYNNIIYYPKNPEKKLKQLGITWDDVEIIVENCVEEKIIEYMNPKLYHFKDKVGGGTISTIYPYLGDYIEDRENYEFIGSTGDEA